MQQDVERYISPGAWALVSFLGLRLHLLADSRAQVEPLISARAKSFLSTLIAFLEVSESGGLGKWSSYLGPTGRCTAQ